MNKKTICIIAGIVVVILILAIICICVMKAKGNKGNIPVEPNNPGSVVENPTGKNEVTFEDFEIDVPEGYKVISGDAVKSSPFAYAKAVAYTYDKDQNLTLFNVYLQNRGESPLNKDAVCLITLYDEAGNFILSSGGLIEEDMNLPVGATTVVRTQFYGDPTNTASVDIDFENPIAHEEPTENYENPVDFEEPINNYDVFPQ